ncbi:MAG: D-alanine--D-alanine ligase [Candidatus Pacebacteria bacterium]|nr:D-alanine--D-alanine ligase [Candidatus Paceibacterota bacterium]
MKRNIAVIFGGRSAEHDVSIITAHIPIINSLLAIGSFNIYPVYISKTGVWYSNSDMINMDYFKGNFEERLIKKDIVNLSVNNGLSLLFSGIFAKSVNIDLVFPAMHGTFGEDGSLMGLLRMAQVPFVGCDLFASAVAMDKVLTKQVLFAENIDIVPYTWFTKSDWEKDKNSIMEKINNLNWPLFVKPVHLGSSIAITQVKDASQLSNAIEVALHYDDKVLVEESVPDLIEVTLPIMGNDDLVLAGVERPLTNKFFDFESKYLSGSKKGIGVNAQTTEIPANISKELIDKVNSLGLRTYRVLGCSGIARVDFLINSAINKIYVNEVNTLPGSLYHHNWKKMGMSNVELVSKLISLAEDRFNSQKDIIHAFKSDILSKMNRGNKS